ncbi:MAG: hypothetical protein ACE5EQ_06265 [Phycisphaerae bacterium]
MRPRLTILSLLLCLAPIAASGCVVHQPRGQGEYQRVKEPRTGAIYHLYLPVDYVRNKGRHPNYPKVKRWPLVMTFHGMKPYDNAIPQEREWEQEADIYGYIVCAPELRTCDSFMEYPLTREHSYVKKDHERVLAIMDHVFVKTMADRKRVLSTSWSCGGYLAHFFPNRHPDRFSCIATRLSNFSPKLMRENVSPAYKKIPVAIFIGDGDFPACKNESEQAVAWYRARGFKVRGKMIDSMGHRRIPQTAAAFFAEQLGIQPLHPLEASKTVAKVHMTDFHPSPKLLAAMSPQSIVETALARQDKPKSKIPPLPKAPKPAITKRPTFSYVSTNAGRGYPFGQEPYYNPNPQSRDIAARTASEAKSPPTGANTTRIASAQSRKKGNWLEPVSPPGTIGRSLPNGKPKASSSRKASTKPRRSKKKTSPKKVRPRKKTGKSSETKQTVQRGAKPAGGDRTDDVVARNRRPARKKASRPFAPKDAGSRRYDLWNGRNPRGRKGTGRRVASTAEPVPTPRTLNRSSFEPTASRRQPARRARRVNIALDGPAIGTAPYYLSYKVNLPRDVIDGADFLWKDNGVWIGDEPQGRKILDAPGLHRVSVLMVTKKNEEYRGMATVQVLDGDPSASRGYKRR